MVAFATRPDVAGSPFTALRDDAIVVGERRARKSKRRGTGGREKSFVELKVLKGKLAAVASAC